MWAYMQQSDDVLVNSNEEGIAKVRYDYEDYFFLKKRFTDAFSENQKENTHSYWK